jgi:hypothetical protein
MHIKTEIVEHDKLNAADHAGGACYLDFISDVAAGSRASSGSSI